MPLRELEIGQTLGLRRGDAVVGVFGQSSSEAFAQCVLSLLVHTDPGVPVLICQEAASDSQKRLLLEDAFDGQSWSHDVYRLQAEPGASPIAAINGLVEAGAPADVVLVRSDCIVSEGWYAALRAAGYSESRVASATALTNAGGLVSAPNPERPYAKIPADHTVDDVAAAISRASLRLRPDAPAGFGHCVYFRRSAIELIGPFDTSFASPRAAQVDFSQRCALHGLRTVLADDVFVAHLDSGPRATAANTEGDQSDSLLNDRYPYYGAWVRDTLGDRHSSLTRSLRVADAAVRGTGVTIDGRCLTDLVTGTQAVTLGVISALDAHTDLRLRVLVPHDLDGAAAAALAARPDIELLRMEDLNEIEPTAVVHRPHQVSSAGDLELFPKLGHRLVLTQLDQIALRNPGYFNDFDDWNHFRRLNYTALAAADQVVFISQHAADDARTLELVPDERINVIPPVLDPMLIESGVEQQPPADAAKIGDRPFLLCLGTDYLHKNRRFAIRLFDALIRQGGFEGVLVLAGPSVSRGSSGGEEAAYLLARSGLSDRVVHLGSVDEAAKQWLLRRAVAVVYPTTYEGFGLLPFEAARVGTPCLFAAHTSLAEILPENSAVLVPWDPEESAERVAPVLVEGREREALVDAVIAAGARFTGASAARALEDVYRRSMPTPSSARLALEVDQLRHELESTQEEVGQARTRLEAAMAILEDPLNRGLVGPDAVLSPELRRAALAAATRPVLRATVTRVYRASRALRRAADSGGRR